MAYREPFRTSLGAFQRSPLRARLRSAGGEYTPPGSPQYLAGAIVGIQYTDSPHGRPNCNAGDPLGAEANSGLRIDNVGRIASGYDYAIGWDNAQGDAFFSDYGRNHTSVQNWGVPVTPGNNCIARAPGFFRSNVVFDNPTTASGTAQASLPSLSASGTYTLRGTGRGSSPYPEASSGTASGNGGYYVGSLPTEPENPTGDLFSVPASSLTSGTNLIGYVQNAAPIAPWYALIHGSGPFLRIRQQFDAQGRVWYEYVLEGNAVTPGEQTITTLRASNYSTPDPFADDIQVTVTVNWT